MTKQEKIDAIKEILDNLFDSELFGVHCDYCDARNYPDDRMLEMGEFNDYYNDSSPLEIAEVVSGTDFSTSDDYFWYDGYGIIRSGSVWDHVDTEEIARYMLEYEDALDCTAVQDLFDEWEEEDEDEEDEEEE